MNIHKKIFVPFAVLVFSLTFMTATKSSAEETLFNVEGKGNLYVAAVEADPLKLYLGGQTSDVLRGFLQCVSKTDQCGPLIIDQKGKMTVGSDPNPPVNQTPIQDSVDSNPEFYIDNSGHNHYGREILIGPQMSKVIYDYLSVEVGERNKKRGEQITCGPILLIGGKSQVEPPLRCTFSIHPDKTIVGFD